MVGRKSRASARTGFSSEGCDQIQVLTGALWRLWGELMRTDKELGYQGLSNCWTLVALQG